MGNVKGDFVIGGGEGEAKMGNYGASASSSSDAESS